MKILTIIFGISMLTGCMPDSLTKFKENAPTKTSSGSGATSTTDTCVPGLTTSGSCTPASSIAYASSIINIELNTTADAVNPTYPNLIYIGASDNTSDFTTFSITPDLPAGVSFDTSTGAFTGRPTSVLNGNSNQTDTYTITATHTNGTTGAQSTTTTSVVMTVATKLISLSYPQNTSQKIVLTVGSIANFSVAGSASTSDGATATIDFIDSTNKKLYVTMGASTATFDATSPAEAIDDQATFFAQETTISSVSYAMTKNTSISSFAPTLLPTIIGETINYSVSPALPNGLSLNSTTGQISGVPTEKIDETSYVITAKNALNNSVSFTLNLIVDSAPTNLAYNDQAILFVNIPDSTDFVAGDFVSTAAGAVGVVKNIIGTGTLIVDVQKGTFVLGADIDNKSTFTSSKGNIVGNDYAIIYSSGAAVAAGTTQTIGSASVYIEDVSNTVYIAKILSGSLKVGNTFGSGSVEALMDPVTPFNIRMTVAGDSSSLLPSGHVVSLQVVGATSSANGNIAYVDNSASTDEIYVQSASLTSFIEDETITQAGSLSIRQFSVGAGTNFSVGESISNTGSAAQGIILRKSGTTLTIALTTGVFANGDSVDDTSTFSAAETTITSAITTVTLSDTARKIEAKNLFITHGGALNTTNYKVGGNFTTDYSPRSRGVINSISSAIASIKVESGSFLLDDDANAITFNSSYLYPYDDVSQTETSISQLAHDPRFVLYKNQAQIYAPGLGDGNSTLNVYTISPNLPAGLSIDSTTGKISGTPTADINTTLYTVTVTNPFGSTTSSFRLKVHDFFEVISSSSSDSFYLHKEGLGNATNPCRVTVDQMNSGVDQAKRIHCFLEAGEGELNITDLKHTVNTNSGVCTIVGHLPYYFKTATSTHDGPGANSSSNAKMTSATKILTRTPDYQATGGTFSFEFDYESPATVGVTPIEENIYSANFVKPSQNGCHLNDQSKFVIINVNTGSASGTAGTTDDADFDNSDSVIGLHGGVGAIQAVNDGGGADDRLLVQVSSGEFAVGDSIDDNGTGFVTIVSDINSIIYNYYIVSVVSSAGFTLGDTVDTNLTSSGTVQFINGNDIYITMTTGEFYQGHTLDNNGGGSSVITRIKHTTAEKYNTDGWVQRSSPDARIAVLEVASAAALTTDEYISNSDGEYGRILAINGTNILVQMVVGTFTAAESIDDLKTFATAATTITTVHNDITMIPVASSAAFTVNGDITGGGLVSPSPTGTVEFIAENNLFVALSVGSITTAQTLDNAATFVASETLSSATPTDPSELIANDSLQGSQPFYEYSCLDASSNEVANIRISVRDWDNSFRAKDEIDLLESTTMDDIGVDSFFDWNNTSKSYFDGTASPSCSGIIEDGTLQHRINALPLSNF